MKFSTNASIIYYRFRFRRDFRIIARFFSDKSDGDGKPTEAKAEAPDTKKKNDSNTEKIQELLKLMMAEPKISEEEYRKKFATAPDIPRRKKSDDVEVKKEKIGKKCYL